MLRGGLFKTSVFLLLLQLSLSTNCPSNCDCDTEENTVLCSGHLLLTLPDSLPSGYDVLLIRNTSIRSITKNAFRKMDRLKEFRVENCHSLDTVEKFAFKGLKKLRLISFTNCGRLSELGKGAFSGISNQFGLRILFTGTPIQRIHGGAFRHASFIRELSIAGSDLAISRHAFASITQLDFLTLSGVSLIEPQIFLNSTRFHIVHIKDSNFEIPPRAFDDLSHVHQFLIQRCRLSLIAPDAFSGTSTIETIELFDNHIGTLAPRAFTDVVNMGRLRIARNTIHSMASPESILSSAIQTRVEENTVECSCELQWILSHPNRRLVDVNYCGAAGVHRSIRAYLRQYCNNAPVLRSVTTPQTYVISNHQRITNTSRQIHSCLVYAILILTIYLFS